MRLRAAGTASRVGNYEQDAREPTLDDLSLIAAAVAAGGHSLEWIVTGNEKAVLLGGKAEVSADVAKVLVPAFTMTVSAHGNGLPTLRGERGGYVRCVFNFNAWSDTGIGECARNDGRLFDLTIDR